jgi:hypothetical protein
VLVIDGTLGFDPVSGVFEERAQAELAPVETWAATLACSRLLGRPVGHGIDAHAGDEVGTAGEKTSAHGAAGIVCVSNQGDRRVDSQGVEEGDEFLGLRLAVAVAVDNALVNPRGKGYGEGAVLGAGNYGYCLARVALDVCGLRVALHLLEFLHGGHLATRLGDLDAVGQEDKPIVDAKEIGEPGQDNRCPQSAKALGVQCGRVEEVQEPVVAERS